MKVVLCTGSRGWKDEAAILYALESMRQPFIVIVGDADGADALFWQTAKKLGVPRLRFNAKWNQHGRAAGMIRNKLMVEWARRLGATMGLAAWDGNSRGTANCMKQAKEAGIDMWRIH